MTCRSAAAIVLVLAGCIVQPIAPSAQSSTAVAPDVIFIPTAVDITRSMLTLAKVTESDVVYDLGSGDGRIPILAATMFHARGVGIELDRGLWDLSKASAATAGVADRVTFVNGDLFAADLRPATVVTLYLAPYLNLKLRAKLLRELRPGARIVSHEYDMGDWKPDNTIDIAGTHLHLWTVPMR